MHIPESMLRVNSTESGNNPLPILSLDLDWFS